jgi:hypothetical protein
MTISAITLPASDSLLVTMAGGYTVDIAPTSTPVPPVKPKPSLVGTVVRMPGVPVFDAQGNAYALTANPGQIAWSGWSDSTGQAAPVTVTSSANVVFLQVIGSTAANPSGIAQGNTSGELWGVAQGNAPGVDLGPIPTPGSPPSSLGYVQGKNPYAGMFGTPLYEVDDFTSIVANRTLNGSSTTWASTIPSPGGGMRNEPENPEREYYAGPGDPYQPFTINPDGSVTTTARLGGVNGVPATPDPANHDYWSGCLCTAGSGGIAVPIGYGLIHVGMFWDKLPDGWPAGWLLPTDDNFNYPGDCEFDIIESWQMLAQYHCGIAGGSQGGFAPNPVGSYDLTKEHSYACYWTPNFTAFYLDGELQYSFPTPAYMIGKNLCYIDNLAVGSNNSWVDDPSIQPNEIITKTTKQFAVYGMPA